MVDERRAIVIGGGIGGLAAAIALRRAGMPVTVFERAPAIDPLGAGLTLWANAIGALECLGLADAVRALAVPALSGGIRTKRGAALTLFDARSLRRRFGEVAIAVHRAELQQILLDALPPGTLRLDAACVEAGQDDTGAWARLADGALARGALLIGADGLRSTVRGCLFDPTTPRYAGYTAWRGVVAFPHAATPFGEWWGCGRRFGLVPLSGGRVYWFAAANAPEGLRAPPDERKEQLEEMFRAWPDPIPSVIAATEAGEILHNDVYDLPPLRRWGAGTITLLGDAAHPMTPNLGQGACQALEDAVVLGRCLRRERTIEAALRRYERARRPRTRAVTRQSRLIGKVAQWENPTACRLRDVALRLTPSAVQQRGLGRVIGYEV